MRKIFRSVVFCVCVIVLSVSCGVREPETGVMEVSFSKVLPYSESKGLSTGSGEGAVAFSELDKHQIKLVCTEGTGYGETDGFVDWPEGTVALSYGSWTVYAQGLKNDTVWYKNKAGVTFEVSQNGVSTDGRKTWGDSVTITEKYCGTETTKIKANTAVGVKNEEGTKVTLGSGNYQDYELRWYKTSASTPTKLTTAVEIEDLTDFTQWENPGTETEAAGITYVLAAIVNKTTAERIYGSSILELGTLNEGKVYTIGAGSSDYIQFGKFSALFNSEKGTLSDLILPESFTINTNGDTVRFAKSNLWYNTSTDEFYLEDSQLDYQTKWNPDHVDKFYWSKSKDVAVSEEYPESEGNSRSTTDTFFAANNFEVEGKKWSTLSYDEWNYLLFERTTNVTGVETANARFASVIVNGVKGLIIFSDEFVWAEEMGSAPKLINSTKEISESWSEATSYNKEQFAKQEESGMVFLPTGGARLGSSFDNTGSHGTYWTSTPNSGDSRYAAGMDFSCYRVLMYSYIDRDYGNSVRLVTRGK